MLIFQANVGIFTHNFTTFEAKHIEDFSKQIVNELYFYLSNIDKNLFELFSCEHKLKSQQNRAKPRGPSLIKAEMENMKSLSMVLRAY